MRTTKSLIALALIAALPGGAHAAFDKGGVLGVGARPAGMGNAYVAVAEGTDAIDWNPAGLVQVPRMEASAFFGPLLNGKEYYMSGAFVMPFLEQTAIGLSLVTLYHDTGNEKTRAFENTYIASFATPMNVEKTVSIGFNLKFLQYDSQATATISSTAQTIEAKAGGVGVDLGGLYQVLLPSWGKKVNFGFLAQDLDTVLRWQAGVEERVPLLIQAGVAYFPEENLAFAIDYSFFNDTNISGQPLDTPLTDPSGRVITTLEPEQHRPHVGIEGWFFNGHLGLRTGYTGFATTADRFTAGVSYKQDWFGVDYAYMGHAEHLGDSHRLSGHLAFGGVNERPRVVVLVNPPTGLGARPRNNAIELQWVPNPDAHVTGYTVYMSKASGGGYVPIQKRLKENKVIVDGLTNGQRYYFVVTSINNSWPAAESNYSVEVNSVPSPQINAAPGLDGSTSNSLNLNNGATVLQGLAMPAGNVAGYNFYMSETSGGPYKKVNDTPFSGTSYPIRSLEVNKRYYFVMKTVSTDNPPVESPPSQEWAQLSKPDSEIPQTQTAAPAATPVKP